MLRCLNTSCSVYREADFKEASTDIAIVTVVIVVVKWRAVVFKD